MGAEQRETGGSTNRRETVPNSKPTAEFLGRVGSDVGERRSSDKGCMQRKHPKPVLRKTRADLSFRIQAVVVPELCCRSVCAQNPDPWGSHRKQSDANATQTQRGTMRCNAALTHKKHHSIGFLDGTPLIAMGCDAIRCNTCYI